MALKVYPVRQEEKLEALLATVEEVRPVLEAHAEEGEVIGTLPQASVDALYDAGLFSIKLPTVLGGAEADPVVQMEIIEAITRVEPSAGWCVMIGSSSVGQPGAYLPDDAIDAVFPGGRPPRVASSLAQGGAAEPVEGGYRVTGQWSFASGIRHSHWVRGGALVPGDESEAERHIVCMMPTDQVKIHDNWHVMGLRGTGSCDFSVKDIFVPENFTWDVWNPPIYRGGALYRLGRPGFVINEHSAFALGCARKALDIVMDKAAVRQRGYYSRPPLSERGAFQRDLGECDLKLRAAKALAKEVMAEGWEAACAGETPGPRLQSAMRATSSYVTQVSVDVAETAFRYSGGEAIFDSAQLQRCLRDVYAGGQHLMVSERAVENHGRFLLGHPDANPMG